MPNANDYIQTADRILVKRGEERDSPNGERSMAKAVAIFNAWTGKQLSEVDGWRFMIALKQAREVQSFSEDNYIDLIGYTSLLGECAEKPD